MKTGHLSKTEVWHSLQSTLWRTLSYPLPAINLTRAQCKSIMAPVIAYALNGMRICKNFPRALVFSPEQLFSLGIPHLILCRNLPNTGYCLSHSYIFRNRQALSINLGTYDHRGRLLPEPNRITLPRN